jgi:hypothetical protein
MVNGRQQAFEIEGRGASNKDKTPSQYRITSLRLHDVRLEVAFEVGDPLGSNELIIITLRGNSTTKVTDATCRSRI